MRLLIVDDDKQARESLARDLAARGYEVVESENGRHAFNTALAAPPDGVISDILMPEMDGYALCRLFHTEESLSGIPFVIFTRTFTAVDDERMALDLGADAFFRRPVDPEVFFAQIRALMQEGKSRTGGPPSRPDPMAAASPLKPYNQQLVQKLEETVVQLESALHRRGETGAPIWESLSHLRETLESIDLGLWDYNLKTQTIQFSQRLADPGCSSKRVFSLSRLLELIHPDDLASVRERFQENVSGGAVFF